MSLHGKEKKPFQALIQIFGAGKETQTPGLFLGKEALYQLSYTRITTNLTEEDYR